MIQEYVYFSVRQGNNVNKSKKSPFALLWRYRKTAICAATLIILILSTRSGIAGMKFDLGDEKSLEVGMRMQVWYQAVDEDNAKVFHDFIIRRPYLYIQGQVMPGVTYLTHIAGDRIGQEGVDSPGYGLGTGLAVRDAWITYAPLPELKIQVGRMYIPFTRADGTESSFGMLALDMPSEQGGIRGKPFFPSKVCRDDGITIWGNIKKGLFQYRLGIFEGQQGSINADRNLRISGRISLSLLDPEQNYYNQATYLGSKKVLSFGAGFDRQADLQWAPNRPSEAYSAWTFDMFLDHPVGKGAVTFEGAYIDIQNAQDLSEGKNYYVQAGYLLPPVTKVFQMQPYVRLEKTDRKNAKDTDYTSGGVNLLFKKQALKLVFDYTSVSPEAGSAETKKSIFTIEFQVAL
jgi:hypothetical protein